MGITKKELLDGKSVDVDLSSGDEEGDEKESDDEQGDMPLFLRRDIPEEAEDPDTHEILYRLWNLRKDAFANLALALEEDDTDMFEEHEMEIRHFNKQMHKVKASSEKQRKMQELNDLYMKQSSSKFIGIDDLPLGDPTSVRKRSHKEDNDGEFRIKLNDQGNQVVRKAHPRTSLNRVVYYLAQQYLREVFTLKVDSISRVLLIHNGEILSQQGKLEDVPVGNGDEIMVFYLQEQQQRSDHPSSDRDHGDYVREESHGLYHAPVGDHADHHRVGSHPPINARASN
jgi:hypothetical protein